MKLLQLLQNKKKELEERLFLPQLEAFYAWAVTKLLCTTELALVHLPDQKEYIALSKSETKKTYSAKKGGGSAGFDRVSFVACMPEVFPDCADYLETEEEKFSPDNWYPVFRSSYIEIWENKNRFELEQKRPVRFGLSKTEKYQLLKDARGYIKQYLTDEQPVLKESEGSEEPVALGVALWTGGNIRGSVIVQNLRLQEALHEASKKVLLDKRFPAISSNELSQTRIEITIISDLYIPLSLQEIRKNQIDSTKGYRISYEQSTRIGWFLPEVFNFAKFAHLCELLEVLSDLKASVPKNTLASAKKEIFEVIDFIESEDCGGGLSLHGSMPTTQEHYSSFDTPFKSAIEDVLHDAARHLLGIQEESGNIPAVVDPFTGKVRRMDIVRLSLAAEGLALAGLSLREPVYTAAAGNALAYIQAPLVRNRTLALPVRTLCQIYCAKTLLLLSKTENARKLVIEIRDDIASLDQNSISRLLAVSLLCSFGSDEMNFLNLAEKIMNSAMEDFQKRRKTHDLASFSEAINASLKLAALTGKEMYSQHATIVAKLLVEQQLSDGGFPKRKDDGLAYTRGVGKIFEVLALQPLVYSKNILKAFEWIRNMQYGADNAYFVSATFRNRILGGFRHDMINPEVWIDASAHVLIGGCRLSYYLETGIEALGEAKMLDYFHGKH